MHNSHDSIAYFRRMFSTWHIVASKANGLSGGLAAIWDPDWIKAISFKCFAGILISAYFRGFDAPINILNIYGPCKDRHPF